MRSARSAFIVGLGLAALGSSAAAASPVISIPAGRLRDAVTALGLQENVSIGLADPGLAELRTPALRGRMTVGTALRRLLAGLPARPERIDDITYRIVRRRAPRAESPVAAAPPAPETVASAADIVVVGSKRDTTLATYAGSAAVLDARSLEGAGRLNGSDALIALIPALTSTNLGPGRNKLFIRGVADSSFSGPTQATVGQYLGEVRLNYNAPDPDLKLVDVASVEVLEGPQGTLYGAGSLGGIIRVTPYPVAIDRVAGSVSVGFSATAHGAPGYNLAAMLNVPVSANAGLRGVAYRGQDGGWIADAGRGRRDVNRTLTEGGRLTGAITPAPGWTVQLGGVLQAINSADTQYAERGLPRLTRSTRLAQPFDNDYALGDLLVTGAWGDTRLVATTGVVRHDVTADYDFTPPGGPATRLRQDNRITLVSNEARLSRSRPDGTGWIVGVSGIVDDERLTRALGPPDALRRIAGVRNNIVEGAAFGEATLAIGARLLLTAGGRVTYAHLSGHGLDESEEAEADAPARGEAQLLPALSVIWRPGGRYRLFARYHEGYRPGGLSVAADGDDRAIRRFRSDTIGTLEAGVRLNPAPRHGFDGQLAVSYAHWEHIQADLIDGAGLPYSDNVGDGRILGLELSGRYRPIDGLAIEASAFLNHSVLSHPASAFAMADGAPLPNVAGAGARIGFSYERRLSGSVDLTVDANARYVGRSRLGIGPALDLAQGRYTDTAASARIARGPIALTIAATNLLDTRGNRFSFGNPYDVASGRQITPLRPRTISVALGAAF